MLLFLKPSLSPIIMNITSPQILGECVFGYPGSALCETYLRINCSYYRDSEQFSFSEGEFMEFRTLSCQKSYGVFFLDGSPIQKCEKPL
jgi:hypothetical protein